MWNASRRSLRRKKQKSRSCVAICNSFSTNQTTTLGVRNRMAIFSSSWASAIWMVRERFQLLKPKLHILSTTLSLHKWRITSRQPSKSVHTSIQISCGTDGVITVSTQELLIPAELPAGSQLLIVDGRYKISLMPTTVSSNVLLLQPDGTLQKLIKNSQKPDVSVICLETRT